MNVNWQAGVEQVPAIVADIGSESSDMSGDLYVWSDGPIGSSNIYAYDFAEANEYPITANPDERSNPATDGRTIVWQDKRAGNYDIYGYDIIDEREFVISDSNWHAVKPSVSGDIVVWRDYRNYHVVEGLGKLKTDIYGADISDPNNPVVFPISTAVNGETDPAVDGNIVVWNDYRHGENKIYAADISDINDPNEFMVSDSLGKQINPDISGNVIIWEVIIWEDYQYGNKVIMSYDIVRQTEKLIVFGEVSDSDIEGDLIVWLDKRNGNWDVYGYDLSAEKEFLISSFDANDANPITGGRIITWQDGDSADDGIYWRRKCDEYLAGDVDDNCIADVNDLVLLALNWLKSSL
jgi:beta propeller repeat protein